MLRKELFYGTTNLIWTVHLSWSNGLYCLVLRRLFYEIPGRKPLEYLDLEGKIVIAWLYFWFFPVLAFSPRHEDVGVVGRCGRSRRRGTTERGQTCPQMCAVSSPPCAGTGSSRELAALASSKQTSRRHPSLHCWATARPSLAEAAGAVAGRREMSFD